MDLPVGGHEMWISDSSGGLTHLDLREPKDKACRYSLSAAKIGTSGIEVRYDHSLVFFSDNGFPRVEHTVEDLVHSKKGKGTVHGIFQHGKSVSSAYWDPRGRSIISTSYDDSIRLRFITLISPPSHLAVLRDKTQLSDSKDQSYHTLFSFTDAFQGKWVTILRAVWSPNPDVFPHFRIGNMNYALDIYSCKGHLIARLKDSRQVI
ncbi:hypothetical protein BD769DRAFT_1681892 [Suillus cothurnatus]|nr:hypothetical protein BD769DRAFT_1681892 [Suillus cothurnatus]